MSFCEILWTLKIALIEPHARQTTDTVACRWGAGQLPHIKQTRAPGPADPATATGGRQLTLKIN